MRTGRGGLLASAGEAVRPRAETAARLLALASPALLSACSSEAGTDGSEILVPYESLSGGMIFSTSAIIGNNGYDLFWVPVPRLQTTEPQPLIRLTHANGNEWQPSVSRDGKGIVFAREDDGIFLISTSGRISRVSDANGGRRFKDSLPAISADGAWVAWVREDTARPIADTGFFETYVMLAAFDGEGAREVSPRPGVIQDAPVFDPIAGSTRLAWSEFNATILTAQGPQSFGIWLHNFSTTTGRYVCQAPGVLIPDRSRPYRCFGQHLSWPLSSVMVTGQDLLEIDLDNGDVSTIWPEIIASIQAQQTGIPDIGEGGRAGFFPRFPLSVSYSRNVDQIIFDGVIKLLDGDDPTLGFFAAGIDGGGVWRIPIAGYSSDLDQANTADFLFSLATPQLVP